MLKLIFFCVAIYIVYRMFANDFFKKRKNAEEELKAETDRKMAAGEMVKDPECGTYVAIDDSISVKDGSQVWHFCSYECRDKFLKKLEAAGHHIPDDFDK